jgi:hypothetical protein
MSKESNPVLEAVVDLVVKRASIKKQSSMLETAIDKVKGFGGDIKDAWENLSDAERNAIIGAAGGAAVGAGVGGAADGGRGALIGAGVGAGAGGAAGYYSPEVLDRIIGKTVGEKALDATPYAAAGTAALGGAYIARKPIANAGSSAYRAILSALSRGKVKA